MSTLRGLTIIYHSTNLPWFGTSRAWVPNVTVFDFVEIYRLWRGEVLVDHTNTSARPIHRRTVSDASSKRLCARSRSTRHRHAVGAVRSPHVVQRNAEPISALSVGDAWVKVSGIGNLNVGTRIRRRIADVAATIGILSLGCTFTTCPRDALPKARKVAAIGIGTTRGALIRSATQGSFSR